MAEIERGARASNGGGSGRTEAPSQQSVRRTRRGDRRRRRILRRNAILAGAARAGLLPSRLRRRAGGAGNGAEEAASATHAASTAVGLQRPTVGGSDGNSSQQSGSIRVTGSQVRASGVALTPERGLLPEVVDVEDTEMPRGLPVPVVGAVAMTGRQREMEDAATILTNLCSPEVNEYRPVHFFGVFDGHGGAHYALMCKLRMHGILREELRRTNPRSNHIGTSSSAPSPPPGPPSTDESVLQETWRCLFTRCFFRTEAVAMTTCRCGEVGFRCACDRAAIAHSGTTALAVVLTDNHVVVANCGDSRAVLYRRRRIVPLSFDHKPDRPDEKARIEAIGGRVLHTDVARVEGILAMSRAIGDRYLKPYVISVPDVTFTRRDREEDEFLVLATDGIWDVMPVDMVCRVVRGCFRNPPSAAGEDPNAPGFPSRSACAASLLSRLAVARGSADNICVVVVDLQRTTVDAVDSNLPDHGNIMPYI